MGDILQPTHLLFVLVVALLVLGPKRLPEVGRALGRGLRDFRSAMSGEDRSDATIPPPSADPPPAIHEPPAAIDPVATGEEPETSDPTTSPTHVEHEPTHEPTTSPPHAEHEPATEPMTSPTHGEHEPATEKIEPVEAVTSATSSASNS